MIYYVFKLRNGEVEDKVILNASGKNKNAYIWIPVYLFDEMK